MFSQVLENPFYLSERFATEDEQTCAPSSIFVDQTPAHSPLTPLLSHDSFVFDFSPIPLADSSLPVTQTPWQQQPQQQEEGSPLLDATANPSKPTSTPSASPTPSGSPSPSVELISGLN